MVSFRQMNRGVLLPYRRKIELETAWPNGRGLIQSLRGSPSSSSVRSGVREPKGSVRRSSTHRLDVVVFVIPGTVTPVDAMS